MDPVAQQPEGEQAELNTLGKATLQFLQFGANASNNLSKTFNDISVHGWIRLIMIVGGYLLLRPWLMKASSKLGVKEMEKQEAKDKAKAKMSPNELRGQGPDEEEDEEEDAAATGADWGQKARIRQREVLKRLIEAEEKRREEEDDLKDIEDLLED